jgi:hypothetical protein
MAQTGEFQGAVLAIELALKGLKGAREAFDCFAESGRQTRELLGQSADVTASGAKEFHEKAVQHADEHLQLAFHLVQDLTEAADREQIIEIQKEFARETMDTYLRQFQELSRLLAQFVPKPHPENEP